MSDLANLFTDVSETLRCETIVGLKEEITELREEKEKASRGHFTVREMKYPTGELGDVLAEGFLDEMETLQRGDLPPFYSGMLAGCDYLWKDNEELKAVKLRDVNGGGISDWQDASYVIQLTAGANKVIGFFAEASCDFPSDCPFRIFVHCDRESPRGMMELPSLPGLYVTPRHLAFKVNTSCGDEGEECEWLQVSSEERNALFQTAGPDNVRIEFECMLFEEKTLISAFELFVNPDEMYGANEDGELDVGAR